MYNTVIFDVDGTLLDSTEGILSSVIHTIETHKLKKITEEELLSFIGPPIQDSLIKHYGIDSQTAQLYANTFREKYSNGDVYNAKVYDGIYELLDNLKNKGCKLGVATYKREDYAKNLIEYFNLDKYFDIVCGSDNFNKLKKQDIICNCLNKLDSRSSDSIMIGDSIHDAIAAENLSIPFIAVTYGFGFKSYEDIYKYKFLNYVNNVKQLETFLIKLNQTL